MRKVLLVEPFEAVLKPTQEIACSALWLPAGPAVLQQAVDTAVRMLAFDSDLKLPCLAWATAVDDAIGASWSAFWPLIAERRPTSLSGMTILRDQARLPGELNGLLNELYSEVVPFEGGEVVLTGRQAEALRWLPADGTWRPQDMQAPIPALNDIRTLVGGCEPMHDGQRVHWRATAAGLGLQAALAARAAADRPAQAQ